MFPPPWNSKSRQVLRDAKKTAAHAYEYILHVVSTCFYSTEKICWRFSKLKDKQCNIWPHDSNLYIQQLWFSSVWIQLNIFHIFHAKSDFQPVEMLADI